VFRDTIKLNHCTKDISSREVVRIHNLLVSSHENNMRAGANENNVRAGANENNIRAGANAYVAKSAC